MRALLNVAGWLLLLCALTSSTALCVFSFRTLPISVGNIWAVALGCFALFIGFCVAAASVFEKAGKPTAK
jgi:hypothetical protein